MKSGIYKPNLHGNLKYYSFYPTPLQKLDFRKLDFQTIELLTKANFKIGELNALASQIKDMNIFLASFVIKEALNSAQIEGTQASLEDVFDANITENINLDVEEVINNIKAINYSISLLDSLPISNRYMKMVHNVLLEGVRGDNKARGEFRHSQNWVGSESSTLETARFIPPSVIDMHKSMGELEIYINNYQEIDDLIKAALIHYQFVTIHPFLDGNGRLGRILIISYLISTGKIKYPCLYLSYYLKTNQYEYYDRLENVRKYNDYKGWLNFFLSGVYEVATYSIRSIKKLVKLREDNLKRVKDNDKWLLTYLETYPIINARTTSVKTNINYDKVNRTINKFTKLNILQVIDKSKKSRTYIYQDYINILKE